MVDNDDTSEAVRIILNHQRRERIPIPRVEPAGGESGNHDLAAEIRRDSCGTAFAARRGFRLQVIGAFNEGRIDFEGEKATVLNGQGICKRYLERWCWKLADMH
jgi:hypothetical protein